MALTTTDRVARLLTLELPVGHGDNTPAELETCRGTADKCEDRHVRRVCAGHHVLYPLKLNSDYEVTAQYQDATSLRTSKATIRFSTGESIKDVLLGPLEIVDTPQMCRSLNC
mmetsp:Transcript_7110/g.21699  ORF Transcript_7110/g.21699 Transcript_7110/m.21699 type:complete len:113 (-) Transcript_7110:1938-2276(-)